MHAWDERVWPVEDIPYSDCFFLLSLNTKGVSEREIGCASFSS